MPDQKEEAGGKSMADQALALLKWVEESPRRLIVTALLVSFGIAAYSVWENRTEITKFMMKRFATVEINEDEMASQSSALLRDLGAEYVAVWSADPARNRRTLLYRVTERGEEDSRLGRSDVLFRVGSELIDPTVELLNARSTCRAVDLDDEAWPVDDANYICAVSVPPAYADGFVGLLVLGFDKQPQHMDYIIQRMSQASQAIIK